MCLFVWSEFADWVFLCSHLCWRQLLQVPVQPERGVCQRCVRPVPGDDRWQDMTFDPLRRLAVTQPVIVLLYFCFNFGGEDPRCTSPYLHRLCKRASDAGGWRKRRTDFGGNPSQWRWTGGCRLLSLIDSWQLSQDTVTRRTVSGHRDTDADLTPNQTLEKRGKVIFLTAF